MLTFDKVLLASAWIVTIIVLLFKGPRNKIREAWVIFMFKQVHTWLFGLVVMELRLNEYPVRLFAFANRTSFSFEYFIYPVICVISGV